MRRIRTEKLGLITAVGGAGVAVGSATTSAPINGYILSVYLDHSAGAATTDTTVATVGDDNLPARTILTRANSVTDAWINPRLALHQVDSSSATYDATNEIYERVPVNNYVTVSIAQADGDDTLQAYIMYEAAK